MRLATPTRTMPDAPDRIGASPVRAAFSGEHIMAPQASGKPAYG